MAGNQPALLHATKPAFAGFLLKSALNSIIVSGYKIFFVDVKSNGMNIVFQL